MLLSSFILCRLESCCTSRTCPPSMYSLCLWREWIYTPMESSMSCSLFSTEWLQEILIIKSHPFSDSSPAMDRHLVFISHSHTTDWSNRGWQKAVHQHVFRHSIAVVSQYICVGVRTPGTLGGMTHYSARSEAPCYKYMQNTPSARTYHLGGFTSKTIHQTFINANIETAFTWLKHCNWNMFRTFLKLSIEVKVALGTCFY